MDRASGLTVEALNHIFDPAAGAQRVYWSKNFKIGLPFSNGAHYASPMVDDLLEAAAAEPDLAKRKADYKAFQEIVDEERPVINPVAIHDVIASRENVKSMDVGGLGLQNNFATVCIEKSRASSRVGEFAVQSGVSIATIGNPPRRKRPRGARGFRRSLPFGGGLLGRQ
jgi:peptide/nickel transport system substrate-binding protein